MYVLAAVLFYLIINFCNLFGFNKLNQKMNEDLLPESRRQITSFSTNQILKQEKKTRTLYYIPCYLRLKVKQLLSIDIQALQATVAGTLLFSFCYGNLDKEIVDQFVGDGDKAILLQFSRNDSILLKEDKGITFKENQKDKMVDFVVRQDFNCNLVGDVFYTPFQVINLYLSITIQSVPLSPKNNNGRRIDIKFNCMNSRSVKLIAHGQKVNLGNYSLANHFLAAKYSNSDKVPYRAISMLDPDEDHRHHQGTGRPRVGSEKQPRNEEVGSTVQLNPLKKKTSDSQASSPVKVTKDDDSKIKNFQYAHFRIPLYQYPGANLINIFIPLWVLGFINLLVFFQDANLEGRLAVISAITLAFIAFVPTINQKIPQTPSIKLIQILIYMLTTTTILCLIDSVRIYTSIESVQSYKFQWSEDGWFIAAMIINIISVFVVIMMFIVHKCFWEKVYTKPRDQHRKQKVLTKQHWINEQCDLYFEPSIKSGKIKVI